MLARDGENIGHFDRVARPQRAWYATGSPSRAPPVAALSIGSGIDSIVA
jgi:hypothetical protein